MEALIEPLLSLPGYNRLLDSIKENRTPVLATGVIDVEQNHLMYALGKHSERPIFIITHNEIRAKEIFEDMKFFNKNIMFYPSKDIIFYSADVRSKDIDRQRFKVLNSLIKDQNPIVVLSIDAVFDKLLPKKEFKKFILSISEGEVLEIDKLSKELIYMGYERTEQVEAMGQFSVRGGIIDIFSPVDDNPYRIELWDDEVDSIRFMDASTQRSIDKVESISIFPMRELVYDDSKVDIALEKIKKEYLKTLKSCEKKGFVEILDNLKQHIGEEIEKISENRTISSIGNYITYFCDSPVSIIDYLCEDTIIFLDEPQRIKEHAKNTLFEFHESIKGRIETGYLLPSQANIIFDYDDIKSQMNNFPVVLLSTVTQSINDFVIKENISFAVRSTPVFRQKIDMFVDEINYLKKENYKILIVAGSQLRCERLIRELSEKDIAAGLIKESDEFRLQDGVVYVSKGRLSKGFLYQDIKFAVFSDSELIGQEKKEKKRPKKKKSAAIQSFTDLKVGDYVVHESHGIGVFNGVEKIIVDNIGKDYIKISYAGGGSLFVPVNQMDLVQKYIGSDGARPKLNKLGGQEWNKAKNKVRASVAILAEDLVQLYAKRQSAKGFVYSQDNVWQREFEENFPYTETDDQLLAIEDVKKDMETGKVMDRLVCGDVGYGKTEVAIRAAFKAVQDGKQVAYLVPTTILAQQHYNTFLQRMEGYPIRVDIMSRFRTPKQQKQTINELEKGFVDIVVGTHRLLSKDVKFKDLGLVIVDEEQRFGVAHKEKLKSLTENVNVLTLTATPIPRTLHMSLAGIRDMSILEEPPNERQPIQTYVMEHNPEFIRDAIHRELSRGGQVYYLYNRVSNISEVCAKIQKLVPEARVAYAHGQMTERELESIMKDFIEGELDLIVCTTIIETGLDIPNVNTIIIQDADRLGLSQLYQIRGRVGRSNRLAYAYLTYHKDKVLQEVAEKRLQVIKEFTEFGSGFKIAMRDLEIRGAGNLLGAEQHGHMETVGYDMYCKLLDEAVRQIKGEDVSLDFETTIDINVNAFIPSYYIKNEEQKLEVYKKISLVTGIEDYYDVQDEIEDRFGTIPKSVQALLDIVLVKAEAHSIGVLSIMQKNKNLVITFKADAQINPVAITSLVTNNKNKVMFTSAKEPYITVKLSEVDCKDLLGFVKNVIKDLKEHE